MICQRTANQADLLLVFDEPFAGVTDDFVPHIVGRLNELRKQHNILLVTNDHVETLKSMADNTIIVSAIDRTTVQVNGFNKVIREKAILALSVGDEFIYKGASADLKFFFEVEVVNNGALLGVTAFTIFAFGLFLASFWDSNSGRGALIIVAASIIAFFCLNPYLLSLVDWRNFMSEEAEALLHSSKTMNKAMKCILTLILLLSVSLVEWGIVNAVVGGFEDVYFWVAILMDSASLTFPFIYFGLYTKLPFHAVEIFASMPFLFMIFFSTTFSPGSGVAGLKELRYLFARCVSTEHRSPTRTMPAFQISHVLYSSLFAFSSFYFWCMIPGVQDDMEGCPPSNVNVVYMILSAMLGPAMFLIYETTKTLLKKAHTKKVISKKNKLKDAEFRDLQVELYGEEILLKDSLAGTNHSARSRGSQASSNDNYEEMA